MATFPTDQPSDSVFPSARFNAVLRWLEENNNIPSGQLSGRPVLSSSSPVDERRPGRPYFVIEDDTGAETITVSELHIWTGTRWVVEGTAYTYFLAPRAIEKGNASQQTGGDPDYYALHYLRNGTTDFYWQCVAPENAPTFGSMEAHVYWFIDDPNDLGGIRWQVDWLQVPPSAARSADLSAAWRAVDAETITVSAGDNNRMLRKLSFRLDSTALLPAPGSLFFVRVRRDGDHDEDTANDDAFVRYVTFRVVP